MKQIIPPQLSSSSLTFLKNKQDEIDKLTTYAEKCTKADEMWTNGRQNATFQKITQNLNVYERLKLCHYCEKDTATDIEHIFPKTLFPNKTFQWENYVYSCSTCNQKYKKSHFAIFENGNEIDITPKLDVNRKRIYNNPTNEDNVFIDLRKENPMNFIEIVLHNGVCEYKIKEEIAENSIEYKKAKYTLDILGLGIHTSKAYREDVTESRKDAYKHYCNLLSNCISINNAKTENELLNFVPEHLKEEIKNYNNHHSLEGTKRYILEHFRAFIQKQRHPSIWEEIKRQKDNISHLKELFSEIPALIYS